MTAGGRSAAAQATQRAGVQLLERLLPATEGESWAERLMVLDPAGAGVVLRDDGQPRVLEVARCPQSDKGAACRHPVIVLLWLQEGRGPLAVYGTEEYAEDMRVTFGAGWSRHRSQLGALPESVALLGPEHDDVLPVRCSRCRRARPFDRAAMESLAAEARRRIG